MVVLVKNIRRANYAGIVFQYKNAGNRQLRPLVKREL